MLCRLSIDDEFIYYGAKYILHSIEPPLVYIQKVEGNKQITSVNYVQLITNTEFKPSNSMKREIRLENNKAQKNLKFVLDTLTESQRNEVTYKYEMIKPILLFEKGKSGDYAAVFTFNELCKEYLEEEESLFNITKEKLIRGISEKVGKSTRQLKRYLAAYNKEEIDNPGFGIEALISKKIVRTEKRQDEFALEITHPKRKEIVIDTIKIRLKEEYHHILKHAIEEYYLTRKKVSIRNLCNKIELMCYEKGIDPISYDTIYHIVKKRLDPRIPDILRNGERVIDDYKVNERGFSLNAKTPLHIVEIDHTQLDIDVIDSRSGVNIGRPWITLGIDVYTRMIWCMHISEFEPSAAKVQKAIEHGIFLKNTREKYGTLNEWDICGIPQIIFLDNGKEFKNAQIKRVINEELNSQVMFRPIATPRYGGVIERVFGTINKSFIHTLAGTRKSSPSSLGDYDAEVEAIYTLDNIKELLTTYITDVYHHEVHRSLPIDFPTPTARYYQGLEIFGFPDFIPKQEEQKYRLKLMTTTERQYTKDGIRLANVTYSSNESSRFINKQKKKYRIKHDLDDISFIYLIDPETGRHYHLEAQSPPAEEIARMSRRTYNLILKELREQGKLNIQQIPGSRDLIKGKALLEQKLNKMAKANKRKRRDALKSGFVITNPDNLVRTVDENKLGPKSNLDILVDKLNKEKSK